MPGTLRGGRVEGVLGDVLHDTVGDEIPDRLAALGARDGCREPSDLDVGKAAAAALIDHIENGTPLPPETVANTTMVTPENWEATMPCG